MSKENLSATLDEFLKEVNFPINKFNNFKSDMYSYLFDRTLEQEITDEKKQEIFAALILPGLVKTNVFINKLISTAEEKKKYLSEFLSLTRSFLSSIADKNPYSIKNYIEHYITNIFPSYTKYYLSIYVKEKLNEHHSYSELFNCYLWLNVPFIEGKWLPPEQINQKYDNYYEWLLTRENWLEIFTTNYKTTLTDIYSKNNDLSLWDIHVQSNIPTTSKLAEIKRMLLEKLAITKRINDQKIELSQKNYKTIKNIYVNKYDHFPHLSDTELFFFFKEIFLKPNGEELSENNFKNFKHYHTHKIKK